MRSTVSGMACLVHDFSWLCMFFVLCVKVATKLKQLLNRETPLANGFRMCAIFALIELNYRMCDAVGRFLE